MLGVPLMREPSHDSISIPLSCCRKPEKAMLWSSCGVHFSLFRMDLVRVYCYFILGYYVVL